MIHNEFPILKFDEDRDAFIRPEKLIKPLDVSERAVICFCGYNREDFIKLPL